ncbi:MAG: M55 family metallopeptidase [Verrucomicrobia bacterium]|nr:M55 family metallopeptidase [Verrucomicrobiota bacterium]MBU1733892.1 M55 family metallopeptidase [Verrucomicrobiota bacterium]MBU1855419.1 M55 family metallopeptidase [Verrucomicrobiota bacterium]
MRIYIMTDLEGVAGVCDSENWCRPEGRYYEFGKELLTREVNAAIEGFMSAGATGFLVADGHGAGAINPALLHSAAELARYWPAGKAYPFSLDDGRFKYAVWIGQHPKAGTIRGHLCHTGGMNVRDLCINGVSVGEFGAVALCAGELGVRTIFASGCQAFTEEAKALVPGIETVAVKRGTQDDPGHTLSATAYRKHNMAAIHLQPEEARRRIREGARQALLRAGKETFGLVHLPPPYDLVGILRAQENEPPRMYRAHHDKSVIALLNTSPATTSLYAGDPLAIAANGKQQ